MKQLILYLSLFLLGGCFPDSKHRKVTDAFPASYSDANGIFADFYLNSDAPGIVGDNGTTQPTDSINMDNNGLPPDQNSKVPDSKPIIPDKSVVPDAQVDLCPPPQPQGTKVGDRAKNFTGIPDCNDVMYELHNSYCGKKKGVLIAITNDSCQGCDAMSSWLEQVKTNYPDVQVLEVMQPVAKDGGYMQLTNQECHIWKETRTHTILRDPVTSGSVEASLGISLKIVMVMNRYLVIKLKEYVNDANNSSETESIINALNALQ